MRVLAVLELEKRCQAIELLVTDVDGVLTDGVIALDGQGCEFKRFHVRDGLGYTLWHRAGKLAAILSGRNAAAVDRRAAELKIAHVLQGHEQKAAPFRKLIEQLGLSPQQVCYMGDDLPDLPALQMAGIAACPADAAFEVRDQVHWVSQAYGGRGAIRELIELILKAQGRWKELVGATIDAPAA
jgi:3-deoxy-D-manno-octulosonate 8-phosphate phosphatase (KDO 8-P phosphatase)